jgi:hypothetical protein
MNSLTVKMTQEDAPRFGSLVRALFTSKGKTIGQDAMNVWWAALRDQPMTDIERGIKIEIQDPHEFPNPGRILHHIKQTTPKVHAEYHYTAVGNAPARASMATWEHVPGVKLVIGGVVMVATETLCPRCALKPLITVDDSQSILCGQCMTDLVHHETEFEHDDYGNNVHTLVEKFHEWHNWKLPPRREISRTIFRKKSEKGKEDR